MARITTADVKKAMSNRWKAPEHSLLWEVGDATGARQTRWADAIIMSLWPCNGVELHGIEIKTARSDWLRELTNPAKGRAVSRYCHRWWIHATPDIVRDGELPDGWGLREFDGQTWKEKVTAALRDAEPMTPDFLAAILRREERDLEYRAGIIADHRIATAMAGIETTVSSRVRKGMVAAGRAGLFAEEIAGRTGLTMDAFITDADAIRAARITAAIMASGLSDQWQGLDALLSALRTTSKQIEDVMTKMATAMPKTAPAS